MDIEFGKKFRELSKRVSESNRNDLELMSEIEAKRCGDGIRAHQRRVRESTGTNAPGTAFTSSDLRGESIGFQPAFDVGGQVHTDDIRVPKERYVTVSTPKREKKTSSENQGESQ